jgi:hypothetical protein
MHTEASSRVSKHQKTETDRYVYPTLRLPLLWLNWEYIFCSDDDGHRKRGILLCMEMEAPEYFKMLDYYALNKFTKNLS